MTEGRGFAVGLTLPFDIQNPAGAAALVEELGFDYVAVGEHVAFHGPAANAFIVLSHAAAVTRTIGLLSAITLVPLYPAPLLAKMAAMTDFVSGGRFELGVGVGGEYPAEFAACAVPLRERGARTDESLRILRALWSGEQVSYSGHFWSFDGIRLQPAPKRQPGPRVWVAGRNEAAIRRAATYGDVWMPYMYTPEQFAHGLARLRVAAIDAGRAGNSVAGSINCFVAVDADADRARRAAVETVGAAYQQDFSGRREQYLVAGTPTECVRRLNEYVDAGADSAIVTLACPTVEWERSAQIMAKDVLPQLRRRGALT